MTSKTVFIDTSGMVAVWHDRDQFHHQAKTEWKSLTNGEYRLITSNYVMDESLTMLRRRLGVDGVAAFYELLNGDPGLVQITPITVNDEQHAWHWFLRDMEKLSFTDATSFALMNRLKIETVFGYDKHFVQAGFQKFSLPR